jgi:hypothetical protein
MIEVGEYDEAQKCTKITEQGDLFIEAQKRKMGVQSS